MSQAQLTPSIVFSNISITTFLHLSIAIAGVVIRRSSSNCNDSFFSASFIMIHASFSNWFANGNNNNVHKILNVVWTIAIPSWLAESLINGNCIIEFNKQNTASHTVVPIMLNDKWTIAVLFAFLFAPNDEIIAVTQVPIFCPIMIGIALPYVTAPVEANAWSIPTEADELWITAVKNAPANTPNTGLLNITNIFLNSGTSLNPLTEPDICSIPNIKTANPKRIIPVSARFEFFFDIIIIKPIIARIGVNDVGFKRLTQMFELSIPVKLRIQDVMVVPTFAPIIIPIACLRLIIPELTKPTTITVVAEELWIIAVTPAPSKNPLNLLDVNFSRMFFNWFPALFSRASPIIFIPKRNNAKPPIRDNTSKMFIFSS